MCKNRVVKWLNLLLNVTINSHYNRNWIPLGVKKRCKMQPFSVTHQKTLCVGSLHYSIHTWISQSWEDDSITF